jgi:hypothetical protein
MGKLWPPRLVAWTSCPTKGGERREGGVVIFLFEVAFDGFRVLGGDVSVGLQMSVY